MRSFHRYLTWVIALLCSSSLYAQSNPKEEFVILQPNEVKVNLVNSIFLKTPSISYERILKPDLGVGGNLGFNLGNASETSWIPKFLSMAFVHWYFGGSTRSQQKAGAGFFIGVNTALNAVHYLKDDSPTSTSKMVLKDKTGAAWGLGLDLGWKYITHSGWAGELGWSAGRYLVKPSEGLGSEVYGTFFISIGKRF